MKRRIFNKLAGGSLLSFVTIKGAAQAQSMTTSALGAGLNPMGGELAGNADGSIPAWTGGVVNMPNFDIQNPFSNEAPIAVIDSSNMAEHSAMLTQGVQAMMTKYGFKIKVYPTHRTACAPQYVYDNIIKNKDRTKFVAQDPVGGRYGFENGYGGIPFPFIDTSTPLTAGGQLIWNHLCRWDGFAFFKEEEAWSVSQGQKSLGFRANVAWKYPYYDPHSQLSDYDGCLKRAFLSYTGPENLVGQELISLEFTNFYKNPQEVWELLNGEGRVRRAPEVTFDTPAAQSNGVSDYDEFWGFDGSPERYDWKYLGKQEMYIPYNNNGMTMSPAAAAHLAHFLNPDLVRWEKHRCWVVEATLHKGERNVLAKRQLYFNEDTWMAGLIDAWDGNGNLFKVNLVYNYCDPAIPGVVYLNNTVHNLQTDSYASEAGFWNQVQDPHGLKIVSNIPDSEFDPNHMAASAQY